MTSVVNGVRQRHCPPIASAIAEVIAAYWQGHDEGNDRLKSDAVRWLRGEFATRADARKALRG